MIFINYNLLKSLLTLRRQFCIPIIEVSIAFISTINITSQSANRENLNLMIKLNNLQYALAVFYKIGVNNSKKTRTHRSQKNVASNYICSKYLTLLKHRPTWLPISLNNPRVSCGMSTARVFHQILKRNTKMTNMNDA